MPDETLYIRTDYETVALPLSYIGVQCVPVWDRLTRTGYSKALSVGFVKGAKCEIEARTLPICGSGSRQEDLLCGHVVRDIALETCGPLRFPHREAEDYQVDVLK